MNLLNSLISSAKYCFIYLDFMLLAVYKFRIITSLRIQSFSNMYLFSFSLQDFIVFKWEYILS